MAGVLVITAQSGADTSVGLGGFVLIVLIIALVLLAARHSRTAPATSRDVLLQQCSPAQCIEVIAEYTVRAGFALTYRGETTATFTRPKRPNMDIGCLLLLLGLVPGLLYFGLYKGEHITTVSAFSNNDEPFTARLVLSGDDKRAQEQLYYWVQDHLGGTDPAR